MKKISIILLLTFGCIPLGYAQTSEKNSTVLASGDHLKSIPSVSTASDTTMERLKFPVRHLRHGITQYPYGHSDVTLTTLPLHVSIIKLQAGEKILSLSAGDTKRWKLRKAFSGYSSSVTPIIEVKPIMYGISTNIIITTNRRIYKIALESKEKDDATDGQFMREVSFYYPHPHTFQTIGKSPKVRKNQPGLISLKSIHTNYKVHEGKYGFPWKPEGIWDDGKHVYIKIPEKISAQQLPVFYVINNIGEKHPINTSYNPTTRIIKTDRLFKRGALIYTAKKHRFLRSSKIEKELIIIRIEDTD